MTKIEFVEYFSGKICWGILLLMWMSVIFLFSHQPGSGANWEPPLWYILERKSAHVFEYAVLMSLAAFFFRSFFPRESYLWVLSIALVFAMSYACLDELHQAFIFGRGARFSDVLIDGGGALIAAMVFLFRPNWLNMSKV